MDNRNNTDPVRSGQSGEHDEKQSYCWEEMDGDEDWQDVEL